MTLALCEASCRRGSRLALDGVSLALQAGENPRVVKEKLGGFMAPSAREPKGAGAKAGAEA